VGRGLLQILSQTSAGETEENVSLDSLQGTRLHRPAGYNKTDCRIFEKQTWTEGGGGGYCSASCPMEGFGISSIRLNCCCRPRRWGETMSLNCRHHRAYCSSPRWYLSMDPRWNDIDRANRRTRRKNLIPVPLCPPQIPHGNNRSRTQATAVRGRRLTA
jgi:hypothetical protein